MLRKMLYEKISSSQCVFLALFLAVIVTVQSSPISGQYEAVEDPYAHAMKRSMAINRLQFRSRKRASEIMAFDQGNSVGFADEIMSPNFESFQNWLRPTRRVQSFVYAEPLTVEEVETYPSTFSLLSEAQMGKRSMAIGRSGFRPGKRSIATGREGFRPGKRSSALSYIPTIVI